VQSEKFQKMQKEESMEKRILERSFDFAVDIVRLSDRFPSTVAAWVIGKQVVRSGTSIGANVEEAQAAYTKDDFAYKMNIALKESRETHYWLRLTKATGLINPELMDDLIGETEEIKKILGAIVSTSRGKMKR
jgi:four helix bundle protein